MSSEGSLRGAKQSWDRAFAEGRLDDFVEWFAEDARLLINEQPEVGGRQAIRSSFEEVISRFDTSEMQVHEDVLRVHGSRGYTYNAFDEILRSHDGSLTIRVQGRMVTFWRLEPGGWRVTLVLTGRSAPDEAL